MQGSIDKEEVLLNIWIPKSFLTDLKSFGVENDLSIKDITTTALKFFLKANSKRP
ncbi:hypothetical protein ACVW2L_001713 [Mucilaginibacter sp. HD30]